MNTIPKAVLIEQAAGLALQVISERAEEIKALGAKLPEKDQLLKLLAGLGSGPLYLCLTEAKPDGFHGGIQTVQIGPEFAVWERKILCVVTTFITVLLLLELANVVTVLIHNGSEGYMVWQDQGQEGSNKANYKPVQLMPRGTQVGAA